MTSNPDKTHFFLRKLHSLTGLAICGFILEHFFTNSASIHALFGNTVKAGETFNTHVHFLHSLPALPLIEIAALAGPFLFHIFYGLYITFVTGKTNVPAYPYMRNFCYTLQRLSGLLIFVFLIVHVVELRLGKQVIPSNEVRITHSTNDTQFVIEKEVVSYKIGKENEKKKEIVKEHDYYTHVSHYMANLGWGGMLLYIVGVLATAFHFANGLFLAGITWGVITRVEAQKRAFLACMAIGFVLMAVGLASLRGFYISGL